MAAKTLSKNKIDMLVALPEGSMLKSEVEKAGYEVIETRYGKDKTFEAGAVFEMIRIIKKAKPDIVHSHASLSARIAALFCGVTNCPLSTIIISIELFGSEGMIFFALSAIISFLLSGKASLYSKQLFAYSKLTEDFTKTENI